MKSNFPRRCFSGEWLRECIPQKFLRWRLPRGFMPWIFFLFFKKYENSLPYIRLSLPRQIIFMLLHQRPISLPPTFSGTSNMSSMPSETNHSKPFPPYLYQLSTHFSPPPPSLTSDILVTISETSPQVRKFKHEKNFDPSTSPPHPSPSSPRRGQIKDPDIQRLSAARSTGEHNRWVIFGSEVFHRLVKFFIIGSTVC